ncbi:Aste57867_9928 [Aphanomyces stellatus]|uniref:Aste57867_9928 protein n=1 Tax=Aphanomyces stellatus TaxID=120398 RepID=A0A485KPQ7_9STRA|nr:hypothetical protein As57867_009889 [Aphanomyces stellatus]VFT86806.1 Aste57867_9928 [Aphanomyces stellatus]
MDRLFAAAMGKVLATKDMKKALDVDMFTPLAHPPSIARPTQSVADFVVSFLRLRRGDMLLRPICVVGIVSSPQLAFWVAFLNAYFDVASFSSLPIPALARNRRLLQCNAIDATGRAQLALHGSHVLDAVSRHVPPASGVALVLIHEPLGTDGGGGHVTTTTTELSATINGKLVVVLPLSHLPSIHAQAQRVLQVILQHLGLVHCPFFDCVMNASKPRDEAASSTARVLDVCPLCLRKVSLAQPQFNVVRRYNALLVVVTDDDTHRNASAAWDDLRSWCTERLAFITDGNGMPHSHQEATNHAHGSDGHRHIHSRTTCAVDISKLRLLKQRLNKRSSHARGRRC